MSRPPILFPGGALGQVEYTISQDRATGNSAQEESNYQLLAAKGFGSTSKGVSRRSFEQQDYQINLQMELFLQEQQEKQRVKLELRRRDALLALPSDPFQKPVQAGESRKRKSVGLEEEVTPNSENDDDRGGMNGGQDVDRPNKNHSLKPPSLKASHQALQDVESSQSHYSNAEHNQAKRAKFNASTNLCNTIQGQHDKCAVAGNEKPDAELNTSPRTADGYCILYRVTCSTGHKDCHRKMYLDDPRQVVKSGREHIIGNIPVPDLDGFINKVAFIVYRNYICGQSMWPSLHGLLTGGQKTEHYQEHLFMVSKDLHAIIQQRSKFAPNQDAYPSNQNAYKPNQNAYSLNRNAFPPMPFGPNDRAPPPALSLSPLEYSHRFLYHHRAELNLEAATATEGSAIRVLSSYLMENPSNMYSKCDNLFSHGLVSHDTLPWLFHPNDVLVAIKGSLEIACVLREFPEEGAKLQLHCWNWSYDGHRLRRRDMTVNLGVPAYGTVRINELAIYPLRFATEETKTRLLANGKRFWNLRHQSFVSYEGPDYRGECIYPSDSRHMLDYQTYYKFHASSEAFNFSPHSIAPYDRWPDKISNSSSLQPTELMLLPPGIHGFFMKEKKWVHLLVAQIQPINWNKTAFDRLVLPKRTKNLIKGLVMVRKPTLDNSGAQIGFKRKQDDIIAGKGSGLIMLLHGGPGTGKTLTAGANHQTESVADLAEMPLYSVTCGDIGTSPEAVEKYLNSVLHLGKKWNCVLLLDEADVFLEERSLQNLERNSLVSVFLRTLEYYDGVLILTSNRVGTFDEAFKSRIHLALHYPPLDGPSRRKIWRNFLDILSTDDENIDVDDIAAHMDKLSSYEMNGRQIRNALATARQLALFEQETLDWDRVKDSIEVASDFDKYLVEVHGHTEEQWQRENNVR
ncbi:hypothetical protein F5Y14DRAFT_453540 [Nemania sp. NC0429]|nr:hypothetical protein F5Y14DRAFT_453540 [Nemania sp. NC0429]